MEIQELSDKDLYARCQEYGTHARVWRRRFAGLLPEVLRRELYRRRGYASIYEFAFKLAGMSTSSVDKVLHLAEKLEDKPVLREQLVSGEQGWSKIEKVAFIATPETDKVWAERVEKMSVHALEAFVQVERSADSTHVSKEDNKFRPQQWGQMNFPVSPEIEKQLRLMKYRLEQEKGITLTYNEVMEILMKGNSTENAKVVVQVCPECAARRAETASGRAIPALVRRLVLAQYQGLCGFPKCARPGASLHHTRRFSLNQSHDPRYIVPLCKSHERLVHSGFIENEEDPPKNWRILQKPDSQHSKFIIDQKVQSHRKESIIPMSPP